MAHTDAPAPRVTRWALRPIGEVFDALADPHTYPSWLVGCREIRKVDDGWPAPGSRFHHRVGLVGPLTVNDDTESLEIESPRHLALEVRFRPLGRGRVAFPLPETVQGRGAGTPSTWTSSPSAHCAWLSRPSPPRSW